MRRTVHRDSVDHALHTDDSFDTGNGILTKVIRRDLAFNRNGPLIGKNRQFQAPNIPLFVQYLNNILLQQRASVGYV